VKDLENDLIVMKKVIKKVNPTKTTRTSQGVNITPSADLGVLSIRQYCGSKGLYHGST